MEKPTYYKSTLDTIIRQKISRNKKADEEKGREYDLDDYITPDFIKNKLIKYNNTCRRCGKGLKLTGYGFRDPDQFSVDRILDHLPHIRANCQVVCWLCNKDRATKKLKLTEYEKCKVDLMIKKGLVKK